MTERIITFNGKPLESCSRDELVDALIDAIQHYERAHLNCLKLVAVNEALMATIESQGMPTCH